MHGQEYSQYTHELQMHAAQIWQNQQITGAANALQGYYPGDDPAYNPPTQQPKPDLRVLLTEVK